MNLLINKVEVDEQDLKVSIFFSNGHEMIFTAYTQGAIHNHAIEGLMSVVLKKTHVVFRYNGRLHRETGADPAEYKIHLLDSAYTQQEIATYWQIARNYIGRQAYPQIWDYFMFWKKRLPENIAFFAQRIINSGGATSPLDDLRAGTAPMIEK